jgi:F0F1-type ATP synthase assembly protein I
MNDNKENFKELIRGSMIYASGSILGPILIFGGIGWIVDRQLGTGPLWMLILIGVAFVVTNILLFSKVKKMTDTIEKIGKEAEESDKEEKRKE